MSPPSKLSSFYDINSSIAARPTRRRSTDGDAEQLEHFSSAAITARQPDNECIRGERRVRS